MYLLKKTHWVGVALGLLSGPALAATINCTLTPANSVIATGETLQLAATCEGGPLASITWEQNGGTIVAGPVTLSGDTSKPIHFTIPASTAGDFVFTVTGAPKNGGTDSFGSSSEARVLVQGVAPFGNAPGTYSDSTTPVNAACGSAAIAGTAVQSMPTGTAQCNPGKAALAITGPTSFSWSCLSLNGGAEANCYVPRGDSHTVTASAGIGGSISPSGSQPVNAGSTTQFTVTANSGKTVSSVTGCNGNWTGSNPYTTGTITGACSVTASFSQNQSSPPPSGGADPGSGSWWAGTNRLIADPTGGAAVKVSYLPGCLNGDNAPSASEGCARATSYDGFSFGNGSVLGLRYTSVSSLSSNRSFKINTPFGGSVPSTVRAWLSTDPASTYESVASACRNIYSGGSPFVVTGGTYCPIQPNTRYYLFIRDDSGAVAARYMVDESRADFN